MPDNPILVPRTKYNSQRCRMQGLAASISQQAKKEDPINKYVKISTTLFGKNKNVIQLIPTSEKQTFENNKKNLGKLLNNIDQHSMTASSLEILKKCLRPRTYKERNMELTWPLLSSVFDAAVEAHTTDLAVQRAAREGTPTDAFQPEDNSANPEEELTLSSLGTAEEE